MLNKNKNSTIVVPTVTPVNAENNRLLDGADKDKNINKEKYQKIEEGTISAICILRAFDKDGYPIVGWFWWCIACLPVLIQIPFFFAIYKMLFVTIEMRHAPFYGWIKDLSAADPTTIFNFFGLIPWDPPSFLIIGAWPIIMGVTMYIQQKLNPAPPDPVQAKLFMFFPFILTILLASFPSGLVIYWSINNILTMAQQYVIIRKTKVKTV